MANRGKVEPIPQAPEAAVPVPVNMNRLKRALAALREAGPEGLTKAELRRQITGPEDLEQISDKTVERCLTRLEQDGAQIDKLPGSVRRFTLLKAPRWDTHVSGEGKLALRLANLILAQSGTLLWEEKMALIERAVEDHMSTRDRELFRQLEERVQVSGGAADSVEQPSTLVLEPILRAMADGRLLQVTYQAAGRDEAQTTQVVPYALTHDLFSGGAYLLTWVPAEGHMRQLRLNRLVKAKVLPTPGVLAHPEKLKRAMTYQIGGWVSDQPPFDVEVLVRGRSWTRALQDTPPALPACTLHPEPGGNALRVRFKANRGEGVLRWVAQFGPQAELVEPPNLREEMRGNLAAALAAYEG
jgi:predicted DNA-binding transcriptional regulator YafY